MTTTVPPQVDYTSRDYTSIVQDLLNAVPSFLPAWVSTSMNDFGIALLELFAWTADIDNYYIDRIANEAFLPTAQLRQSILNLASLIDYQPASPHPSVAYMSLTLQIGAPAATLPAGSQFSTAATTTQAAILFETPVDYTLPANTTGAPVSITTAIGPNNQTVSIQAVQSVTITAEAVGTSVGTLGQTFALYNPDVIDGSVTVFVDEGSGPSQWIFYNELLDAGPTTPAFNVAVDANGVYYLVFGNNINGRVPVSGGIITANYQTTSGLAGNVAANSIVVDRTNTTLFSAVTNVNPATGGSDAETNDQIRANAPKSLTALNRCVSLQDYASVALGLPAVTKAAATSSVTSSVILYAHPVGGPYDVDTLQTLVLDPNQGLGVQLTNANGTGYLDSRKPAGTSVTVLPPTYDGAPGYLPVVLTIDVNVLPQYLGNQVAQDVTTALDNFLDFGSMNFGALITESAIYHVVMAVPGVDYATISEMRRGDANSGTIGNIQAGPFELIALLSPSSITVLTSGGL
jgi:hypothetical protein